jgi:acetyl esterase/lipase
MDVRNKIGFDPRMYLVGHSAGAQLSGCIVLEPKRVSPQVYAAIKGVVGIEGIYDIPFMDQVWPAYKEWFIVSAMGPDIETWKDASPQFKNPSSSDIPPYLILHSENDELLDVNQSLRFADHLKSKIGASQVQVDVTSLTATHDQVLKEDAFYQIIQNFVRKIENEYQK